METKRATALYEEAGKLVANRHLDRMRIEVGGEKGVPDRSYHLLCDRAAPSIFLEWRLDRDGVAGYVHFEYYPGSKHQDGFADAFLEQFESDLPRLQEAVKALTGIELLESLRDNDFLELGDTLLVDGHRIKVVLNPDRRNVVFGQVPKETTLEIDGEIFEDLPIPHSSNISMRARRPNNARARLGLLAADMAPALQTAIGDATKPKRTGGSGPSLGL